MFFWKKSRGGRVALNVRLENNIACALSACQLYHTSPVWAVIIISPVVFVRRMASRPLGVLIATTIPSASIISIKTIATGSSSASFYFFRRVIPPQNMSRKCRKIGSKIRRAKGVSPRGFSCLRIVFRVAIVTILFATTPIVQCLLFAASVHTAVPVMVTVAAPTPTAPAAVISLDRGKRKRGGVGWRCSAIFSKPELLPVQTTCVFTLSPSLIWPISSPHIACAVL